MKYKTTSSSLLVKHNNHQLYVERLHQIIAYLMVKQGLVLIAFSLLFATNGFAQYQHKIDSLKQVIPIAIQDTNKVNTLNLLAAYYKRVNLDSSLQYSRKALNLSNELNFKNGIASSSFSIGLVYYYRSNYDSTIYYWKKDLVISEELNRLKRVCNSYNNIGLIYRNISQYSNALEYNKKALEIAKQIGFKKGIANAYNNLGTIDKYLNDYDAALANYKKSLEIKKELNDRGGMSNTYTNIGIVYFETGNYKKAIDYYKESLSIDIERKYKRGMSSCYNNMGLVYKEQGSFLKAIDSYNKSLIISEESGNKKGISNTFNNIGVVYMEQKNYPKALEYFNKALTIRKEMDYKYGIAQCYNNIGLIHRHQHNTSEAFKYYKKSLSMDKKINNKMGISTTYSNIAALSLINSNDAKDQSIRLAYLDSALVYGYQSLIIAEEIAVRPRIIDANSNIATAYWGLKQIDSAYVHLKSVIDLYNKNILMNFSFISEREKANYFATINKYYWKYNSFALEYKDSNPSITEKVYNNTVKNKGLLLKSNTAMRNAIYLSNDSMLMQEYDNWIFLKRQIAKRYSNGEDATQLENKADSLEGSLVKKSNEFSDFKKVQNINWKQIQASLKENEVAIEFLHFLLMIPDSSLIEFTNQVQYAALIVTKNSKYPKMIPLFEEKQLESIIGKFGGNNYSYINSIYGRNDEVNSQLYNLIWEPIDSYLDSVGVIQRSTKTKTKVYISPDGLLHKISFPAIAKEQDVYLCDAYDIEMKTTTGKIANSGQVKTIHESSQLTATLFGGINYDTDSTTYKGWTYLEGTNIETKKIDKILKKGKLKVNYYNNTSATEEEFKTMATNSNILHIATHGFFYPDPNDIEVEEDTVEAVEEIVFRGGSRGFGVSSFVENRNPLMRSGLVFAGANDVWSKQTENDSIDDGVLTAQEVANIDMRKTDLVVMSACETGLGDIKGSEGVYGLQRAFKMAGVDYMIMSLWQVPDKETEEFMTKFYKKLVKTKNIKQSFVEAQKEMRKKYDPYFWAAFVLIE